MAPFTSSLYVAYWTFHKTHHCHLSRRVVIRELNNLQDG